MPKCDFNKVNNTFSREHLSMAASVEKNDWNMVESSQKNGLKMII